ncbi:hypothetical protein NP493_41g03027 [Ridgeia piscesae]|uniref:Uncharacterized protein n=1 Tax=Ridgeia piscesae TaxID=27915 RepID=A0AAD9PC19_RIDPI|nr:hypothetical protein NP493_41g03027 [Ridgeia piscesae]
MRAASDDDVAATWCQSDVPNDTAMTLQTLERSRSQWKYSSNISDEYIIQRSPGSARERLAVTTPRLTFGSSRNVLFLFISLPWLCSRPLILALAPTCVHLICEWSCWTLGISKSVLISLFT